MPATLTLITSAEELNSLIDESYKHPIVLFKHSNSCGISADILHQLGEIDGDINVVVIQENRPLSNLIAERIGHRHQSPQVFVIKDGESIYHATHYGIDPKEISRNLIINN